MYFDLEVWAQAYFPGDFNLTTLSIFQSCIQTQAKNLKVCYYSLTKANIWLYLITKDKSVKSHREETGELIIVKVGQGLLVNTSNIQSLYQQRRKVTKML